MRVAFDARELQDRPTGVGRVLAGLLGAWPADDELVLVVRSDLPDVADGRCRQVVEAGPRWLPGSAWEQAILPGVVARIGADRLVCPAYGMPWRRPCPTAVGMHDCSFAAIPGTFRPRERLRRRLAARIAARRAAFLFMGTRFAADEAGRRLGVASERLLVLPYGVSRRFRAPDPERLAEIRRRYRLGARPVLFVGSQLPRRRLPGLAEALGRVIDERPGVDLCMVGTRPDEDGAPVLANARWLGYVADDDLPALYGAARVLVYPSRYEGFGLPVLEALACSTPVLTADIEALAETYRGHALLLPLAEPDAWAAALARLLDDDRQRDELARAGAAWARGRDWETPAHQLRRRLAEATGRR